jgi:predicted  nucleic acid-binding Zn-ribbon protein
MLENENNGVHSHETVGNGVADPKAGRKKRVLTRDLSERIAELEKKLEASAAASEQVAALSAQIAKLDERVSKIAHAVAQLNLRPAGLA